MRHWRFSLLDSQRREVIRLIYARARSCKRDRGVVSGNSSVACYRRRSPGGIVRGGGVRHPPYVVRRNGT